MTTGTTIKSFSLALLIFSALTLGLSRPAHAQYPQYPQYNNIYYPPPPNPYWRPHFYLGAEAVGVAVIDQTGPRAFLDHGGGFNLFLGGRFNRFFALEFGWQPTFHNNEVNIFGDRIGTIGLEALTLDAKLYPFRTRIVQPFFTIGAGAYLLGDNFSVFAEGPGYQIGGGVDFWITRHASIGLKVQYRGVALIDYDVYQDNTYLSLITGSANLTARF